MVDLGVAVRLFEYTGSWHLSSMKMQGLGIDYRCSLSCGMIGLLGTGCERYQPGSDVTDRYLQVMMGTYCHRLSPLGPYSYLPSPLGTNHHLAVPMATHHNLQSPPITCRCL